VRCVFAGTPAVAVVALRALLGSQHEVVAVLTRPDARSGRGRALAASPVAELAREAGLEVLTPTSLREASVAERLRALRPQVAPVVAYGQLIPAAVLPIPEHGWVNLHFSVLPHWRGAAPVQHAIWRGDDVTGASTFRIEEGLDTGPLFGTLTETIRPTDTAGDLLGRLAAAGSDLLLATLDAIEAGSARPVEQLGEVTYAPKLTVENARVRWQDPAVAVDRQIRACTPDPGAWTMLGAPSQVRVGLGPVRLDPQAPALAPGVVQVGKHDVHVGTATVPVRLGLVRPAGKRQMPAADWARGARLASGDALR
jgi:methionyl-tRNA formyltransferase